MRALTPSFPQARRRRVRARVRALDLVSVGCWTEARWGVWPYGRSPFPLDVLVGTGTALCTFEFLFTSFRCLSLLSPSKHASAGRSKNTTLIGGSLLHLSKRPLHVKSLAAVLESLSWVDVAFASTHAHPCIAAFSEATSYTNMTMFTR